MGSWNHIFLLVHTAAAAVTAMCLGHSSLPQWSREASVTREASAQEVTDNLKRFHKVISWHFVVWIVPLSTWVTLDAWSCENLHTRAALCMRVGSPNSAGMLPRVFRPAGYCSRAVLTPELSCLVVLWGPSCLRSGCGWGGWRPEHFLETQIISVTWFPAQMERSDGAAKAGRRYPAVLFPSRKIYNATTNWALISFTVEFFPYLTLPFFFKLFGCWPVTKGIMVTYSII